MEFTKRSFSAGEISPELHVRADLQKFSIGVKECTNFFVKPEGGAYNRPGFRFVAEIKDSSQDGVRLIPFRFNTEQTYVLETGDQYIRFVTNGGQVLDSGSLVYEVATPYALTDIERIQYTQSADVMTWVHPNYPITEVSRLDNDDWSVDTVNYGTTVSAPTNVSAVTVGTASTSDDKTYEYVVTAVRGGVESQASTSKTITMDAQSVTWGAKVNWSPPVGGADYYNVYKAEVVGSGIYGWIGETESTWFDDYNIGPDMTEGTPLFRDPLSQFELTVSDGSALFIGQMIVGQTSNATAIIDDINGNDITVKDVTGVFQSGETIVETSFSLSFSGITGSFSVGETVTGSTSGATATVKQFFYINDVEVGEIFSLLEVENISGTFQDGEVLTGGTSGATATVDSSGSSVNVTISSITFSNYPSTVAYYQQRILFASTYSEPQTFYTTRTGNYKDFRTSSPTQDDDAITFTIADNQVNEVRHIVSMGILMALTSGGVWKITEGENEVLTPASVGAKKQTEHGASWVKPLLVGDSVLYVQEQGTRIRDLIYTFEKDKYQGNDVTKFARHLFKEFEIIDWAYQDEPDNIVWAVRSDGKLLGLTYNALEQVMAWHVHETDGEFESVACVREGNGNALYAIIKREINGETKRYIERMDDRHDSQAIDSFYVDSGLTYEGVPADDISGLDHLEGKDVAVLADGHVVNNMTVSGGSITLPYEASKVQVGLPYTSRIVTLRFDHMEASSIAKNKRSDKLSLRFINSRGGWVGQEGRQIDEIKWREQSDNYEEIPLKTQDIDRPLSQGWSKDACIVIEQRDPLPMGILGIQPKVTMGG